MTEEEFEKRFNHIKEAYDKLEVDFQQLRKLLFEIVKEVYENPPLDKQLKNSSLADLHQKE